MWGGGGPVGGWGGHLAEAAHGGVRRSRACPQCQAVARLRSTPGCVVADVCQAHVWVEVVAFHGGAAWGDVHVGPLSMHQVCLVGGQHALRLVGGLAVRADGLIVLELIFVHELAHKHGVVHDGWHGGQVVVMA